MQRRLFIVVVLMNSLNSGLGLFLRLETDSDENLNPSHPFFSYVVGLF